MSRLIFLCFPEAEALNITDKAVSKWERGVGYPDITTLTKLAKILGVKSK